MRNSSDASINCEGVVANGGWVGESKPIRFKARFLGTISVLWLFPTVFTILNITTNFDLNYFPINSVISRNGEYFIIYKFIVYSFPFVHVGLLSLACYYYKREITISFPEKENPDYDIRNLY